MAIISIAQAPEAVTKITRLAFRNRFTGAEKVALYTAAASSVQLRVYLDDLSAATYVDLTRADTIAGVNALELSGVIGAGRASEILTNPVTDEEAWRG